LTSKKDHFHIQCIAELEEQVAKLIKPFNFISGIPARFDIAFETLLYNSNRIIRNFHRNFKIIPAGSAYRAGTTAKKSNTYVQNRLFPTILADRRRCPAFGNPIFRSFTYHPGLAGIVKKRIT